MADLDTPAQERWTDPESGLIVAHPYERSHYSGAGNCWCGRAESHRLHIPHPFVERRAVASVCVCGLAKSHHIHQPAPESPEDAREETGS